MAAIARRVTDKRMLRLIGAFLKVGVLEYSPQHLRPQPSSGAASDDECHALSCTSTKAQSKRGQECGGSTSRAEVPGVQLQQQQRTEAAHCAKGPVALQAENSGTDATDARNQSGTNAEGTDGLLKGLEELLRLLSDTLTAAETGSMDTPSFAVHDLEAVETRKAAVREVASPRDRAGSRRTNGGQPTRPLASGEQSGPCYRDSYRLLRFTWSPSTVKRRCVTL